MTQKKWDDISLSQIDARIDKQTNHSHLSFELYPEHPDRISQHGFLPLNDDSRT
jgi:hypothetical protein